MKNVIKIISSILKKKLFFLNIITLYIILIIISIKIIFFFILYIKIILFICFGLPTLLRFDLMESNCADWKSTPFGC